MLAESKSCCNTSANDGLWTGGNTRQGSNPSCWRWRYYSRFRREIYSFATPGHTLGHVCCFSHPYLFCGDTLFSGGCGRLFEGTPSQMYQSLMKINSLPDDTLICCAHEYTLANIKFALSILPHDSFINEYYRKVKELRVKTNDITRYS